jgi:hypothetical protein
VLCMMARGLVVSCTSVPEPSARPIAVAASSGVRKIPLLASSGAMRLIRHLAGRRRWRALPRGGYVGRRSSDWPALPWWFDRVR